MDEMDKDKLRARIGVMNAALNGERIQTRSSIVAAGDWIYAANPAFNWIRNDYRVEPAKELVPLTRSDLPPTCWLRKGDDDVEYLIIRRGSSHVVVGADTAAGRFGISYDELLRDKWQYSDGCYVNGNIKWQQCSKEAAHG